MKTRDLSIVRPLPPTTGIESPGRPAEPTTSGPVASALSDGAPAHPCDACGGSGEVYDVARTGHWVTLCPVCLGAGSFPDQMPVADALADAETLAHSGVITVSGDSFNVVAAALFGLRAVKAVAGVQFKHHGVWEESRLAARAAFRAVPGLRG